jgi:uncharacterized protein
MDIFRWPAVDRFLNRSGELAALEDWFTSANPLPLAVYGRRRVGKSWLLRKFTHGRPGLVLVAERIAEGLQLDRFAEQLAPAIGAIPRLNDAADLIKVVLDLGRNEPITVVIDEFPYLLPSTTIEADRALSRIQAVLEEDGARSSTRLIISGSIVSQMTSLFAERNPLHGRFQPFELRPLSYVDSAPFLSRLDPIERFERYAITGGTARYLDLLGTGPLGSSVVGAMLNPNASLWNEGRSVVEQELRQPAMYFGLLQLLSSGDKDVSELSQKLRTESSSVVKYLETLRTMRLVERKRPIGSAETSRQSNWHLADPFLQFWFRFVFPHQADLESGLSGEQLFNDEIAPFINEHVSHQFELWCCEYIRRQGLATTVGQWWGNALNIERRTGNRSSEEIDVVGVKRGKVVVVGEAKWTTKPMGIEVLHDLIEYKIPALEQAGFSLPTNRTIVLFSRSGFAVAIENLASKDPRLLLVDAAKALIS